MARTTNIGFYTLDSNRPNWHHFYNANVDLFLANCAKFNSLNDVDVKALQHGSIIKYNSATAKWEVVYTRGA